MTKELSHNKTMRNTFWEILIVYAAVTKVLCKCRLWLVVRIK